MTIRPGLLFDEAAERKLLSTWHTTVKKQFENTRRLFQEGLLDLPSKMTFYVSETMVIKGRRRPSEDRIACPKEDPATWQWHMHLSAESDDTFLRFYEVTVGPGNPIVIKLCAIRRPPPGE